MSSAAIHPAPCWRGFPLSAGTPAGTFLRLFVAPSICSLLLSYSFSAQKPCFTLTYAPASPIIGEVFLTECGAVGSAGRLGRSGRRFESCHSDFSIFYSMTKGPICPHRWQIMSSAKARNALPLPVENVGNAEIMLLPQASQRALRGGRRAGFTTTDSLTINLLSPTRRSRSESLRGSFSSNFPCPPFPYRPHCTPNTNRTQLLPILPIDPLILVARMI